MKSRLPIVLFSGFAILFLISNGVLFAQNESPKIKIDLNISGRPIAEVSEPGWTPWAVGGGASANLKTGGIEFKLSGGTGQTLTSNYYKAGVQQPHYARLTSDGVTVAGGKAGENGEIILTIKGLPAGKHNLITYHNTVDLQPSSVITPIDVYVDGNVAVKSLTQTSRVFKPAECALAVLEITAQTGKEIEIRFKASGKGNNLLGSLYLNAFTLNVANPALQARSPLPANNDEHAELLVDKSRKLSWESSPAATAHEIYFGKDSAAVAAAGKSSPLFKGSQARPDTSFSVTDLYSLDAYYWRIDEVNVNGIQKGEVWMFRPRQLAFKGAEGYGRFARGGRGGKVVEVTNLNDNGPGSLRWAVTNDIGPRTIVFAVSGIIELQSRLVLSHPNVTIAAQTAPGKGICIRKSPFGIGGNDAIIRFVRLRLGAGPTADGMGMNGNHSIMDHCSISWTIDESFSSRGAKNITLQRTLISEALNIAGHKNYPKGKGHGYAATIGGDIGSFHHNLLAHNAGRNWSMGGGLDATGYFASRMDISNNVVYNWVSRTTDGGAYQVNFLNNYYKPGPATKHFYALTAQYEGIGKGTQKYYFAGNIMPGHFGLNNQEAGRRSTGKVDYDPFVNTPFFPSEITLHTAEDAYKQVLSDVGANQPFFDLHDVRMVRETLDSSFTYTGSIGKLPGIPDSHEDVGGYENYPAITRPANWDSDHDGLPDWWEKAQGTNLHSAKGDFSDANADANRDGFTALEDYLQWMAEPHYFIGLNQPLNIDLKQFALGFENKPFFAVSDSKNGKVDINPVTGMADFSTVSAGMASFNFTVTDSVGAAMTRTVGILVDSEVVKALETSKKVKH